MRITHFSLAVMCALSLAILHQLAFSAWQPPAEKKEDKKNEEETMKPIVFSNRLVGGAHEPNIPGADPRDAVKTECPHKVHVVKLLASKTYQIDMIEKERKSMDPFLRIEDANKVQLIDDDDSGGDFNARIFFTPPKDGDYRIIATCWYGSGEYTIKVGSVVVPKVPIYNLKNGLLTINGQLAATDNRDDVRQGMYCKVYFVRMAKGKNYQIDMVAQLDSYLRLEDMKKVQLAEDDDGGGFPNARIVIQAPETGIYRVIATSFTPNAVGPFTLTVREN